MVSLLSASVEKALIPTAVPTAAFSATVSAVASLSMIGVATNSLTSRTAIVNTVSLVDPSALVARTVMLCIAAASRSRRVPSATVTTPDPLSIAKRPPALSVREYVTAFVVASLSLAEAVMPTIVPIAEFSSTAFAVPSASTDAVTSNSSRSLSAMLKTVSLVDPS